MAEEKKDKKKEGKNKISDPKDVKNEVDTEPTIDEEFEQLDEVLTRMGRRKLAISARKNRRKLQTGRKKRKRRRAEKSRLTTRSRKSATKQLRSKIAGKKGKNYSDLSPAAKSMIDRRVSKRKTQVDRLAKREMPKQRRKDMSRLRRNHYEPENGIINEDFESFLGEQSYHDLYDRQGRTKTDGRFKMYRRADKKSPPESIEDIAKEIVASLDKERMKTETYIKKKAEEFNESYDELINLYDQGLEEWTSFEGIEAETYAMNKVYSYLNERVEETQEQKKLRVALKLLDQLVKADPKTSIGSHAYTVTREYNVGMRPRELANLYQDIGVVPQKPSSMGSSSRLFHKYLKRALRFEEKMTDSEKEEREDIVKGT